VDPKVSPVIDPAYLSSPEDVKILIKGRVKLFIKEQQVYEITIVCKIIDIV
jgi:hypothetical protein